MNAYFVTLFPMKAKLIGSTEEKKITFDQTLCQLKMENARHIWPNGRVFRLIFSNHAVYINVILGAFFCLPNNKLEQRKSKVNRKTMRLTE